MEQRQKRVLKVLSRIQKMVEESEDEAIFISEALNNMLEDLSMNDAFGTEGQMDPRGDMRDETYSMDFVQGIDD